MNLKETFHSRPISSTILLLAILLIILLIFQAGMFVGYRKASFGLNWRANFYNNPDDPQSVFAPFMHYGNEINPRGIVGEIISVRMPHFIIKGAGPDERIVYIDPNTAIRCPIGSASTSDLVLGQHVVVIGRPGEKGILNATLIRLLSGEATTSISILQSSPLLPK